MLIKDWIEIKLIMKRGWPYAMTLPMHYYHE